MVRLLHLSDLHLSSDRLKAPLDDHKPGGIAAKADRRKVELVALKTLEALVKEHEDNRVPCVVVVSGDLTEKGHKSGFDFFKNRALPQLIKIAGSPRRIVVVPGNHDVMRGEEDDRELYYGNFVSATQGCTRPYIEGFDPEEISPTQFLLERSERLLVLPIDSCRYSSRFTETPPGLSQALDEALKQGNKFLCRSMRPFLEKIVEEVRQSRHTDAARITDSQLDHLRRVIEKGIAESGVPRGDLVKVAVLHHQLLPVTLMEEDKAFETFTNLMRIREFLRDQGFKVVLHGHKHSLANYEDLIPDFSNPAAPSYRTLNFSAPSFGYAGSGQSALQRLDLSSDPLAPFLTLSDTPHALANGSLLWSHPQTKYLYKQPARPGATDGLPNVIWGSSIEEVHARAMVCLGQVRDHHVANLVCPVDLSALTVTESIDRLVAIYNRRCQELQTAGLAPKNLYPADAAERFEEILDWWLDENYKEGSGGGFNHGSRLKLDGHNQLDIAHSRVSTKPTTTKAILSFVRPDPDLIYAQAEFPSFCSVQLIERHVNGQTLIDAIAYFRKQEMGIWWLFNMAEILRHTERFIELGDSGMRLGRITTYAARATLSEGMPEVSIPALERATTLKSAASKVEQMVAALSPMGHSPEDREVARRRWEGMLIELVPPEKFTRHKAYPVVAGLDVLLGELEKNPIASLDETPRLREMLLQLQKVNRAHAELLLDAPGTEQHAAHGTWATRCASLVRQILSIVEGLLGARGA